MDKNKKRNDMREEILKVVMNHMEKAETAFKITDELCILFGVSESNPLMDDMQNCIILAKPNYLHKDGKISSACYKIVGEQKIYFTHKDNLYSR
jgi:hypothetical protein